MLLMWLTQFMPCAGMAMIGSEESQAYYGDLNRVRQDASRKLHKLEVSHVGHLLCEARHMLGVVRAEAS